ncbi:MAG: hypothetical protein ACREPR_20190 [Brasilonema sp.]
MAHSRHASLSLNVTSKVQCSPFSTLQWRRIAQQFQIQILTTGTVYLEDKGVFLQGHRDGADDTEFWGNAGISPTSDR